LRGGWADANAAATDKVAIMQYLFMKEASISAAGKVNP